MKDSNGLDKEICCTFYDNIRHKFCSEKIAPSFIPENRFRILFQYEDWHESSWDMYGVGDLRLEYDMFEKVEAIWYRSLLRRLNAGAISNLKWGLYSKWS